jgi:two-component system, NarL family, nitrate/nitrite response regulator NarL
MELGNKSASTRHYVRSGTDATLAEPDGNLDGTQVLTLVIASEVRFSRESLGAVLGRGPNISVLGYGADLGQTMRLSRELRPDMVLLDAAMHDGPSAVRRLREARAGLLVVAFALSESVEAVLAWAEAGVSGYIPNTAGTSDLQALIAEIGAGRQMCSPLVAAGLLRRIAATAGGVIQNATGSETLTPRELEIVSLISAGLSNKEIARHLSIGLATTKSHVHNVLGKLNVQSRGRVGTWMRSSPSGT